MKPKLKPPGTKRLKLNRDTLLSTSAFKFNLRRYSLAVAGACALQDFGEAAAVAGAYTRPLFSST
jgi:hypothetical protein